MISPATLSLPNLVTLSRILAIPLFLILQSQSLKLADHIKVEIIEQDQSIFVLPLAGLRP